MKNRLLALVLAIGCFGTTKLGAQTPLVVADIPPVHSLVSMVMGDLGAPHLLLRAGASPHDYSLRPSDASKLAAAELVVFTSNTLTPWLSRVLSSQTSDTVTVELIELPGTQTLIFRQTNLLSTTHDNQRHDSGTHGDSHDDDHGHSHGSEDTVDPHAWLDPENAIVWITSIADQLSGLDPNNSTIYQSNAQAAVLRLGELTDAISQQLSTVQDNPFVVFHDSYQYFENRFSVSARAAISLGDASRPGITQINQVRTELRQFTDACVFSEPQFNQRLVNTVVDGLDVKQRQLDPLGAQQTPGATLYEAVLSNLSDTLFDCLSTG